MPAGKGTRLVKRGATWYVIWTGNSRGVSTGTGDGAEAESFLATFILERARGGSGKKTAALTVSQALNDYECEHVTGLVADRGRAIDIRAHLEAYFAHAEIETLQADDFTGYIEWRRAGHGGGKQSRKAKDPTIRRELGQLVAAFNHAVKYRRLGREKVPFVPLPQGSVAKDHWLYEEECDILLRSCLPGEAGSWQEAMAAHAGPLPRVFGFVAITLEAPGRKRSVETLTKFQVDMKGGRINLAPPGHRQTAKRRPTIPISLRLRPVLERLIADNPEASHILGTPGSVRVAFQTAVRRAEKTLEALGRPERAQAMRRTTPHTLRHTWATIAAQKGVSLWDIAGVLGDSIQTVERNYAHHCPDFLRGAINFRTPEPAAEPGAAEEKGT